MAKNTKKTKKNTIASITKAIGTVADKKDTLVIGEGENQVSIDIKKRLSLSERADMVSSIVSMVWAQDNDENDYFAPYLRKFAYDFNIINYFTNIELPDDMNKVWDFVDGTNITIMVMDAVGNGYVDSIIREANEAIEYKKSEILKRSKLDGILDSLSGVMNAVGKKTENLSMDEMFKMISENAPELKEELGKLINTQIAEGFSDAENREEEITA